VNETISEEQQQIKAIVDWFKENGTWVLVFLVAVSAFFYGPGIYQNYKNSKIFPGSDQYEEFSSALSTAFAQTVVTEAMQQSVDGLADRLIETHTDTHYAFLASLGAAKLSAQVGSYGAAQSRLSWAAEYAKSEADKQLVNYRLALVEMQLGNTDAALNLLEGANEHFAAIYAEARGDVYSQSGDREKAIQAYQESIDAAEGNTNTSYIVELKLANLETGLGSITEQ